ncbi:putative cytochrome P450 [Mycena venus]|uniref:Putative cytochrome P450 n=1 Tax=Mycena venus TaxID=2733690 RepID=A0A8H7DDT0_9AGAR|nr:putative cytochrome P450 [Mycena venus]
MAIVLPLALGVLCVLLFLRKVGSREAGLPPGPPTIPLLGNLHMFPTEFVHYKFTEWARKYGGIYSLKMGPGTAVVLTDMAAVKELMDKRSGSTVDRPPMHVADLVAGGLNMVFASFLRHVQRSIARVPGACALQFVFYHNGFYTHIRRYSNSVILSVLYGKRAPRYETPETTAFFNAQHEWELVVKRGATPPVDLIPILKYVPPRWAKWKRDCAKTRKLQRDLYFGLLDETKERLRRGEENGSYMEEVLTREEEFGMDREMTGYLGGVLIEGGSDTTSTFLQSLILAMVAYPEAQRKAQEEMDRVVGEHRMPTLEDLEEMPYIRAMVLETHRFRPVAPLLIPHSTLNAEEVGVSYCVTKTYPLSRLSFKYKGFIIPQGATIFVNAWGIFHDPELYDDPESFIPDRYLLTENGMKPGVDGRNLRPTLPFGVGRRICPGIHLAQNSININAMNLVWAFNFTTELDGEGNPVKLDTFDYQKRAPRPFKCKVTPRSTEKAELIEREFLEAADTFSKVEFGISPEDKAFVAESRVRRTDG